METWSQIETGVSEPNSKQKCDLKLRPIDCDFIALNYVYSHPLYSSANLFVSFKLIAVDCPKKYCS